MKHKRPKAITMSPGIEEQSTSTKKMYWFLAILTFLLFANTLRNDYNMDDELVTRNHPLTSQGLSAVKDIFTSPYYKDEMGYSYGYRPIIHLSFALEYEIFGEKAAVSHLINVVLYILTVLLLLQLILKWVSSKNNWIAFVAVLFFAIHPVHTEVVASIKNRDEILAFLFMVLSGLFLHKIISNGMSWFRLLIMSLLFTLGLLSKESVFPMVFVLPITTLIFGDINWKKYSVIVICLFIPAAIISSKLDVNRLFMIFKYGLFAYIFIYLALKYLFVLKFKEIIQLLWNDERALVTIISVFSLVFLIYSKQWFTIFSFPILLRLVKIKEIYAYFTLSIVSLFYCWVFGVFEFAELSVLIVIIMIFTRNNITKSTLKFYLWALFVCAVSIALETNIRGFEFGIFVRYVAYGLFFFLYIKKPLFALLFALLAFLIALWGFGILIFGITFYFLFSMPIWGGYLKKKLIYLVVLTFSLIGPYQEIINMFQTEHVENSMEIKGNQNEQISSESQTRVIEYVENTLIQNTKTTEKIATGFYTLGEYFRLMVYPLELSFYYGFSKIKSVDFNEWKVWLSVFVHLALVIIALIQLSSRRFISLGIFWYITSIILFSNWVELVPGMVGERLAFTASAGFSIFFAGLIFWIKPDFNWRKPKWVEWSVFVVLILFASRTVIRNADWKNAVTLMSNDIKHLGNSAQANNLLALKLLGASNHPDTVRLAIKHFEQAIQVYPDFFNVQFDLARTNMMIGDTSKAINYFNKVIALDPTFPVPFFSLIDIYSSKGDWKAYMHIAKKLHHFHRQPNSYIILAKAYLEQNDKNSSLSVLTSGLEQFPENNDIRFCLDDLKSKF